MSAPILRTAAQTIKAVPPPTTAAIDAATAARSAVTVGGRSPAASAISAVATSTPPPVTAAGAGTAGAATRSLATSAGSPQSSTLLNKAISETLKDTARVVDQTSSEGLEKMLELSEGAMQRTKENLSMAETAAVGSTSTVESSSRVAVTTSTTTLATATTAETTVGGIAQQIQSQAVTAFAESDQADFAVQR